MSDSLEQAATLLSDAARVVALTPARAGTALPALAERLGRCAPR